MSDNLDDILERVLDAREGGWELDEELAEALFGVSLWKSKHGGWNISFPNGWKFGVTNERLPGREPGFEYDPATGRKLPPEMPPHGWSQLLGVELPTFSTTVDGALELMQCALAPGTIWRASNDLSFGAMLKVPKPTTVGIHYAESEWVTGNALSAPLSIVAAVVHAVIKHRKEVAA